MKKMIYGAIAPRVKHPTMAKKTSVKPYPKSDMVHMMLELKYVLSFLPNLKHVTLFSYLFKGNGSIASMKRSHY